MDTTAPLSEMDTSQDGRSKKPVVSPSPSGTQFDINFQELEACHSVLSKPPPSDDKLYCKATFDTWLCWNYTPAGTTAYARCPYYFIPVFNPDAFAEKKCMPDGSWFRNKINRTWTDYTPCTSHQETFSVLLVYISGYILSAILLIASISIFCCFRQLRCTRVILHQNLFVSYIVTGLLWTVSYTQVLANPASINSNAGWCKVVHVIKEFISLSNYYWMFCEGFFLHTIIVHAFSKEKKLLRICYSIGWGVPVIPTIIYAVLRAVHKDLDIDCWVSSGWPMWIIHGPITASLVINFIFFLNILRILLSKIRAFNNNEQSQYRRAVKAVLIMIPLLGVNNLIMLVRPEMGQGGIFVWKIISAFLVAYQGAFAALIFCFFNGEVMTVLRRKWDQWRGHYDGGFSGRRGRSPSNTTAFTLDDNSVPKNGFPCGPLRTSSNRSHAQDPTELQLMMNAKKNKDLI